MISRYCYASYRTREKAEAALEDMFASGDITEGERPVIQYRRGWYCIMLPVWC